MAYKREGIKASDMLNAYNRFLSKGFVQFPSNLLIKSANRQEMSKLEKKADYQESGLLFFSNPDINDLNLLKNYPIEYKLRA